MNIKRILFATDFSECSNAALDGASHLAKETGARLFIVHVNGIIDVSGPAIPPVEPGYYIITMRRGVTSEMKYGKGSTR